jgi:molybdopterin molybdotransferase
MPLPPAEALSRILALAEPEGPIEVSLLDALGLYLAEDATADVAMPPTDRACSDGYAVRLADAAPGSLLRVAGIRRSIGPFDDALEAGEAIRVRPGDPFPADADAFVAIDSVRPDPETGPVRVIEVLRAPEAGLDLIRRGQMVEAGAVILPAGTRLEAPMVSLLASQGCVHPVCRRRVRVAVVAVGDHLVPSHEAPVMQRVRNIVNPQIVALASRTGAMPHDLQAVSETDLPRAFERATSAPIVVVHAPSSRATRRTFREFGVEPVVSGVRMRPGSSVRYGVIRDDAGSVAHHVFQLPMSAMAGVVAFSLLIHPLIARLQGDEDGGSMLVPAIWEGPRKSGRDYLRAIPVALGFDTDARHIARPVPLRGRDDLAGLATANGLAILPADLGPWVGGEVVQVYRFR